MPGLNMVSASLGRRLLSGCLASASVAVFAGLATGAAIRDGLHHGHAWPRLAVIAEAGWAAWWLTLYLPYRATRRRLLRERAILLGLMGELNEIAGHRETGAGQ